MMTVNMEESLKNISFESFQKKAYSAIQNHDNRKDEDLHYAIGLGEECGEVQSVVKHKWYSGEYDFVRLVEELGDILWYLSALCTVNGIDLQDVAMFTLAKLQYRYPYGEFSAERSVMRHKLHFEDSDIYKELVENILQKSSNRLRFDNK